MIEPLVLRGILHETFHFNSNLFSIYVHFISCSTLPGTCNLSGNFCLQELPLAMNCQNFSKVVFWEHFSYDAKQTLTCSTLDTEDQSSDHATLFGENCFDYFTAAETEVTCGMKRGTLFNFDSDITSPTLCHFWFYVALPLTRMISFLTTRRLRANDFPFTGPWLPLNLSLNARSALHFMNYSQGLASTENLDDPTSPMILVAFKLEHKTLVENFKDGNFGLWNRRYLDYLSTLWSLQLSPMEWGTVKTWEFEHSVGEFRAKLDTELAYGRNSRHVRFYHMPLLKIDFESLTGEDLEENESAGWELVFSNEEARSAASTLSNSLDNSVPCPKCFRMNCGVNHTSEAAESTLDGTHVTHLVEGETIGTIVTTGTFGNHVNTVHQHLMTQLHSLPLIDEVYVSEMGAKFHFTNDCKGLQRVTTRVNLVPLEEALASDTLLCRYCEDTVTYRTLRCCIPGCTFTPTFMNFHCCHRCADGKATLGTHGRRCAQRTYNQATSSGSTDAAAI